MSVPFEAAMEKRKHDRHLIEEPGILRMEGVRGGIYLITVLDVSQSGFRISCSVSLPTGTRVEVKCRGAKVLGLIRYTRNVGQSEFHLGVEAESASAGAIAETGEIDLTLLFRFKGIGRGQ